MRRSRFLSSLVALVGTFTTAPARSDDAKPDGRPPRLVVLCVVDQLRADYLERFGARLARYGGDGFLRLAREGAVFSDCRHRHGGTFTGPGHATIGTGAYPSVHGIVGNQWLVRGQKEPEYCVHDESASIFGAKDVTGAAKVGVANLRGDTLGDAMKFGLTPRPKVIGVSIKDRGAILLAGRRADAAFWLDPQLGGFVSSGQYGAWREGPDAAAIKTAVESRLMGFNEGRLATFSKVWERDPRAGAGYEEAEDDARPEENEKGKGNAFPHAPSLPPGARDVKQIETSPSGNELVEAFVEELIPFGPGDAAHARSVDETRLALGAVEGETDLLCVSFSSTDVIGHRYGPESQEAADALVRLDATIGKFLGFLDAKIGKGRWLFALTADHGAAPIPEWSERVGLGGGRLEPETVKKAVEEALSPDSLGFQGVVEGNVYFDRISDPDLRRKAEERVRDALIAAPGIWRVYTRTQLLVGQVPDDGPGRGALLSFDPVRSGDVVFQLAPFWMYGAKDANPKATHGTPWSYDQRVPLILFGPGIVPGPRPERASVVDLVATLTALLHVTPPAGSEGRPLLEAIDLDVWKATIPLK